MDTSDQGNIKFLRMAQVRELTTMGRSTILERVARGEFPKPVRLSPQTRVWVAGEVDRWMSQQAATR